MGKTAAVYYEADAYNTDGTRLLGRQAAGEGFLKGLVRYGQAESLFCFTRTEKEFSAFCNRIGPWSSAPRKVTWLPTHRPEGLSVAGTLYRPDPDIADLAWRRRFHDQRAYSICGVTHTIASKAMQRTMGELLLAPVQPWDAVICASQSVRHAYEKLFDHWGDYLSQRMGGAPFAPPQLPIIPLGVDCASFPQEAEALEGRRQIRQQLGIGEDDIVILFVGRLIFYAKAHPVPLYLALERAARATRKRIHFIQAGWFENEKERAAFLEAPKRFAPGVNTIFLDGRQPDVRKYIWSAGDIFVSLSDNIQETFGLTPIEAMASGLPVVVADWDGYQESIRDGEDGFKIPTCMPPSGSGLDLAEKYLADQLNYSMYIAHPSLATMVDVEACAKAFITLIEQPDLRQRMGENGCRRAREVYDWRKIISAYEQLWAELAEIRAQATEIAPRQAGRPPHPLCMDPFELFSHYTPRHLSGESLLETGDSLTPELLEAIRTDWMSGFGADMRLSKESMDTLLALLEPNTPQTADTLFRQMTERGAAIPSQAHFIRTLGYLLKFNLLRLTDTPV